jgi:hypothetical protein
MIPAIPQSLIVSQGNGRVFLKWAAGVGALSYVVQRSDDRGATFNTIGSPSVPEWDDTSVVIGSTYLYQVKSVNGPDSSGFTPPQTIVPTPNGEMCLGELRTQAKNQADRLNSDFVSESEWNFNINQSLLELYDLLVDQYEDYFVAPPARFQAVGNNQMLYPLPNGVIPFFDPNNVSFVAQPFYKLLGADLAVNTAQNANVTIPKFNFRDRNKFVYPNTASTIYGVFNLRYRLVGNQIEFIPVPSAGQWIQLWYIPRMPKLLADSDITITGISGWLEYVIVDAAIKALDKEESPTEHLVRRKAELKARIEESAVNRDAGQPDTVTDVSNSSTGFGGWGGVGGFGGPNGGF